MIEWNRHTVVLTFISTVMLLVTYTLFNEVIAQESEYYTIEKLESSISFDGHVDETEWGTVKPLPLVTHWPHFGDTVGDDKTVIRVAHDSDYFYVSCICYSDPDNVRAPTYKRDEQNMSMDDLGIIIDPFNDDENGLWFVVTPSGARTDGDISNDATTGLNTAWSTIWEAEARITDFGWTAEMRIPFNSIRFESDNGSVRIGLTAYRYLAHNASMHIFPAISDEWGGQSFAKPSQTANIVLQDIETRTPVFVTPYVLSGVERSSEPIDNGSAFEHDTDVNYEVGLDVKMGLSNSTTLDLTLNTDFAQVEADDEQINLTRFSLFFPERRQFFLERASVFEFGFDGNDRLFFSRSIGLNEGQPVRILGGARAVTRTNAWDVGLLSMQTGRSEGLESQNHSVLRVRREVFNTQSFIGGIVTSRVNERGAYNINYGLDAMLNLWGNDFLGINAAHTLDRDGNSSVSNIDASRLQIDLTRRTVSGLNYSFNINYSGELYSPAMGFQAREDFVKFGDRVSWGWIPTADSPLQLVQASLNGLVYFRNSDLSVETAEVGPWIELTWKRGDFATGQISYNTENVTVPFLVEGGVEVPRGSYQFPVASMSYHTPRGRSLRAVFQAEGGGFFDGNRLTIGVEPTIDPSRIFNLSLFYQFNRIDISNRNQRLNAHVIRLRPELTLNRSLTLSSFAQLNSAADRILFNARFRFNPRDGVNLFLALNDNFNTRRGRTSPPLPLSDNRSLTLKYEYTF